MAKITIKRTDAGFALLRDGEPITPRGAGGRVTQVDTLAAAGANTLRIWTVDNLATTLDRCAELGLLVHVGFRLPTMRKGHTYTDEAFVRSLIDDCAATAERWKDHDAVLCWSIGNEVTLHSDLPAEPCYKAINRISQAIHEADPNHPTTTVLAYVNDGPGDNFMRYCPDVDILGVNNYGRSIGDLSHRLRRIGLDRTFMHTEFGPRPHWQSPVTGWGARVEQWSSEKPDTYRANFIDATLCESHWCLGSYAFLWGHKHERTATWYGMFLNTGEKLEAVDMMTQIWSGRPPQRRCPRIHVLRSTAEQQVVRPGTRHKVEAAAGHPDREPVRTSFRLVRDPQLFGTAGEGETAPDVVEDHLGPWASDSRSLELRAPAEPGPYRLYMTVYDDHGAAATANFPFYVGG